MTPILTLISDWRLRDPYIAMFKGDILSQIPQAHILDVTHHVDVGNIDQTAFLMRQSYRHFPDGSLHLLLTKASATARFAPVALFYDGHWFIGEDNGVFSLMFGNEAELKGWIFENAEGLNPLQQIIRLSDAVLKGEVERTAKEYTSFDRKITASAYHFPMQKTIEGEIIYIDANYNAVTNIPVTMFRDTVGTQEFTAVVHSRNSWKIRKYHDKLEPEKEMFLTDNSLGCIEITLYQGRVAALADLQVGDKVEISYGEL